MSNRSTSSLIRDYIANIRDVASIANIRDVASGRAAGRDVVHTLVHRTPRGERAEPVTVDDCLPMEDAVAAVRRSETSPSGLPWTMGHATRTGNAIRILDANGRIVARVMCDHENGVPTGPGVDTAEMVVNCVNNQDRRTPMGSFSERMAPQLSDLSDIIRTAPQVFPTAPAAPFVPAPEPNREDLTEDPLPTILPGENMTQYTTRVMETLGFERPTDQQIFRSIQENVQEREEPADAVRLQALMAEQQRRRIETEVAAPTAFERQQGHFDEQHQNRQAAAVLERGGLVTGFLSSAVASSSSASSPPPLTPEEEARALVAEAEAIRRRLTQISQDRRPRPNREFQIDEET